MSQPRVRVIVSGAFFAVFGGVTLWQSLAVHYMTSLGPGPGFFGVWMGIGMLLLSVVLVVRGLGKTTAGESGVDAPQEADSPPTDSPADIRKLERVLTFLCRPSSRVAMTVIGMFALVLTMPLLGYRIAVFFFTILIMRVVTAQSWLATLLVALVTSVLVFYVFHDLLNVALPVSGLGV